MKQNHYILACLLPFLLPYSVLGDKSTQQYLTEGNAYLTSGEYNNALTSFDAAIRREPDNYLTYFKRATAYLSLGRNNAAAQDFSTILNLKPDFDQALMQRARIYVKEGDFKLALQDLKRYLNNRPTDTEAQLLLKEVEQAKLDMKQAQVEKENMNYDACISLCSSVSRISPLLAKSRLMRAQCHVAKGELEEAAGDFARVAQLNPSDPEILILLSKINFYALNEPQGALTHVKQCLHYDPEQKDCKKLFRRIKKLTKELTKIETDVELKKYATASNNLIGTSNRLGLLKEVDQDFEELEKQLNAPSKIPKKLHLTCYELACKLFAEQKVKEDDKIEKWCSMTLSLDENNLDALTYRGQVLLNRKEFEAAVRDLEKANELSNSHDAKIRQLLHQAQQKLRLSKKKDYYKMLDVSPNADSREIKKAYRKKAHEWHPDKYSGDLEKEQVERKMAEINQAYEVLSDPDKRQQYDNGFDPNDPDQGNQGGGSPFQHQQGGFNFQNDFPFGGQGFPGGGNSFKWQFN